MKKYISTIFVAALTAAAAVAEETETKVVDFSSAISIPGTQTYLSTNYAIGSSSLTGNNVKSFLGNTNVSQTTNGWYSGVQSNSIGEPLNHQTVGGFNDKESGMSFQVLTRRTDHDSTYGALVLNVGVLKASVLQSVSDVTSVDTLTGSFVVGSIPGTISPATFSAWTYDASADSVGSAVAATALASDKAVDFSVSLAGLDDADNICLIWGATPNGAGWSNYQVNDLKVSVNGKHTVTVPEPATATLSLLALAGLAARRRRK